MRIAALDAGSSSFHLIVGDVDTHGNLQVVARAREMLRLGESTLAAGVIAPETFQRGLEALRRLHAVAEAHRPETLRAVATSAIREARNADEFVRAAAEQAGVPLRVIDGQEEARLAYLGARSSLDLAGGAAAIFDLGGGSLEVILGDEARCSRVWSLALGPLRLAASWRPGDPPGPDGLAELRARIDAELAPVGAELRAHGFASVAFTGGAATSLARLLSKGRTGAGQVTSGQLARLAAELAELTVAERRALPGMDPKRADTSVVAAIVLGAALEVCRASDAVVCRTGLREGLIADELGLRAPGLRLACLPRVRPVSP